MKKKILKFYLPLILALSLAHVITEITHQAGCKRLGISCTWESSFNAWVKLYHEMISGPFTLSGLHILKAVLILAIPIFIVRSLFTFFNALMKNKDK